MKSFLFIAVGLLTCWFVSCKKTESITTKFLVHNATYDLANLTASWNGSNITASALSQGQTSGTATAPYQLLPAGTNNIIIQSGNTTLFDKNIYAAGGNAFSLLVYDTGQSVPRSFNAVLLQDDLSVPDTSSIGCRFVNCAPATDVIFVLLRKQDTAVFGNSPFIGKTPDPTSFQSFTHIQYGTWMPAVVDAGTGAILFEPADSVILSRQRIYSFIYSGTNGGTGGSAIKLQMITHL